MGKPASTTSNVLKGTRGNDLLAVTLRPSEAWTVDGAAGNDILYGGAGRDTLLGGAGDDIIFGLPNDAKLDGGLGFDALDLSLATGVVRYVGTSGQVTDWGVTGATTTAPASGFERVIGGRFDDYLFGNTGNETLVGGGGADRIEDAAGNDTLVGGYLPLSDYNPRGLASLPDDDLGDFFQFSNRSGGNDRVLDFEFGEDHLFFYGVPQPDVGVIHAVGSDLVVGWANGTVTLVGLASLAPDQYGGLLATTNGEIFI